MWQCPKCETMNNGANCMICNEPMPVVTKRPAPQPLAKHSSAVKYSADFTGSMRTSYPKYSADYSGIEYEKKKSGNAAVAILICLIVVLVVTAAVVLTLVNT